MKNGDPLSLLPGLPQGAEILIIRLRSLGDLVLETSAIAALHQWRRDLRIVVLAEKRFEAVFEGNPAIAGLLFSGEFLATAGQIRRRRFPIAFNQHGGPRSALLTAASGAALRVGWKGFQYGAVYNVRVPDAAEFYGKPGVHTVEHRLSQFYWTGLPRGPIPQARVFPQGAAVDRLAEILARHGVSGPYSVLQPEARVAAMRWPVEKFAEIARWLRKTYGMTSVVNAATNETAARRRMQAAFEGVAVVPEPLGLAELIALISRAGLFVGNDSGPVHVAAATLTPTVVIYGPTNPAQWHPWQSEYRVVSTGAQFRGVRGDKMVPIREPGPIASIGVDEVRAAIEELLTRNPWSGWRGDFDQAQNA